MHRCGDPVSEHDVTILFLVLLILGVVITTVRPFAGAKAMGLGVSGSALVVALFHLLRRDRS